MPFQDLNVLLLEPLICCLGCVFWVIVMLEYPYLSRGNLKDFSPSRRNVLPIVFLVTIVPAALRSLTRSSCVVLG